MSTSKIIRTCKDPSTERASARRSRHPLPGHPAGVIELEDGGGESESGELIIQNPSWRFRDPKTDYSQFEILGPRRPRTSERGGHNA